MFNVSLMWFDSEGDQECAVLNCGQIATSTGDPQPRFPATAPISAAEFKSASSTWRSQLTPTLHFWSLCSSTSKSILHIISQDGVGGEASHRAPTQGGTVGPKFMGGVGRRVFGGCVSV